MSATVPGVEAHQLQLMLPCGNMDPVACSFDFSEEIGSLDINMESPNF